ncbi:MAG TPA: hypothetical protein VGL66_00160 [Caulobacteraceae bacterium]|jgi:DNA-binding MarR family transcriptional regulator
MSDARQRDTILAALEIFMDEGFPRSLTTFTLFLYASENEGLTVSELAHVSSVQVSMAARVVKTLAGQAEDFPIGDAGAIFELRSAKDDKRLKFVFLTPRGQALRDRLDGLIAAAVPIAASRPPEAA